MRVSPPAPAERMAHSGLWSIWLALVIGTLSTSWGQLIPRLTFPLGSPGRSISLFTLPDVSNSTTLLLSEDEEVLVVGARNTILSLNISHGGILTLQNKLDWSPTDKDLNDCSMKGKSKTDCPNFIRVLQVLNSTHMYTCGTFAFSPRCAYINSQQFSLVMGPNGKPEEGRGRCPYNPYQKNTAITVDGELYTGTVADYRGNRPVISRHLSEGGRVDLKLDDTPYWLEDPTFISSAFIRSEGKVYFFFTEIGREYDFFDKFTVSRIAQVCTSDVGGQRTLQRRWTTFTKAQLLCQANGELPYNVLQDVATLSPPGGSSEDDTLFYGIFSSQWSVNSGLSAVCMFNLRDVKGVFGGNYKTLNRDTLKWTMRVQEKVTRPGECGLHNASDNVLRFVKENFLAEKSVLPSNRRLMLVSPDQRYTNLAAQRVRDYTVLYLLTERGYLHKAVLSKTGIHIVEEIQVITQPQLVKNLLLSVSKAVVLVGTSQGVVSVPFSNCSYYGSCAECVLARDPFCAWDRSRQVCADISSLKDHAGQDVEGGSVSAVCSVATPRSPRNNSSPPRPGELVTVSLNEVVKLQCPRVSRLAQRFWERPDDQLTPSIYLQCDDGATLSFLATPTTLGRYLCQAMENGFTQTLVVYEVRQKDSTTLQPPATSQHQGSQPTEEGQRGTTGQAAAAWTKPKPKTETPHPTSSSTDMSTVVTHRNVTRKMGSVTQAEIGVGDQELLSSRSSYLQDLIVVSVLLALCIFALIMIGFYNVRQQFHHRTMPEMHRDAEMAEGTTASEREVLRAQTPYEDKRSGNSPSDQYNSHKSSVTLGNGVLNGSHGHLPNVPI
ncbi:semaphorin-4A isoform X2 [Electrophorus electricus]|uniref:Sema domain-containing protein n=1 Tax=Electrophorus electricus TaxID=8005 RepID=A0AAY5EAL6_ELEEL|nr:semaphorin-4A isoform X2 [Electrophorus electricus]